MLYGSELSRTVTSHAVTLEAEDKAAWELPHPPHCWGRPTQGRVGVLLLPPWHIGVLLAFRLRVGSETLLPSSNSSPVFADKQFPAESTMTEQLHICLQHHPAQSGLQHRRGKKRPSLVSPNLPRTREHITGYPRTTTTPVSVSC